MAVVSTGGNADGVPEVNNVGISRLSATRHKSYIRHILG